MDKASDFESEHCGFDPHPGQILLIFTFIRRQKKAKKPTLRVGFEPPREDPI